MSDPVVRKDAPRRPGRKPQARSAATRESILDAALECLVERGYARTATADVAERAGVSRGAQLHHFPTRAGLLAATVEHLAERRLAELRRTVEQGDRTGDEIDAAVDFVWDAYTDPTAYASLELLIASRTDDDLLAHLRPVAERFEETLERADLALAPDSMAREQRAALRKLVVAAIQGLAVQRVLSDDDAHVESVLGLLKDLCRRSLGAEPTERESRKSDS
ncbi:MAG: TetR/AcrR family transcriptional regulator [Myxococcales bacterium]|nr:TetR/AcrR family transcriptional regulator [Myxococcales bacterium]